jgi:hypothetical protein
VVETAHIIESVRESWFQGEFFDFELFLHALFGFDLFLLFSLICRFLCLLLALQFFLLLDDFLELFLDSFGLLVVLHVSWIQISNFVLFVVNVLFKGEIEKPCGQYLGLLCDE